MPSTTLYPHQNAALCKMHNGCILCGGVGSGKSRTAIAYFYKLHGGEVNAPRYKAMKNPCDLYIITTAKKRDSHDWSEELANFMMSDDPQYSYYPKQKVVIDSWNNIQKYKEVADSFFIFDEQRVCGTGKWVKAFLQIAKHNRWILLSATPGDTWSDYAPVFIANGFYRNLTDFNRSHAIWKRCNTFWKIEGYTGEGRLLKYRNDILVDMSFVRKTERKLIDVDVGYNVARYKEVMRNRWDYVASKPIENAGALCLALRKIVNCDISRQDALLKITDEHPRAIVFYSFDYELDILLGLNYAEGTVVAQWNGHKHQELPTSERWVYLVQYTSGCEGWNCTQTDTIIFFSQQYSYKVLEQAKGRIDRLNTPYKYLYYYTLRSRSSIDIAIMRALDKKQDFNERGFAKWQN